MFDIPAAWAFLGAGLGAIVGCVVGMCWLEFAPMTWLHR